ncbi:MAG: diheme cytochrome c, partial [Betaproteobacteria bacterium]|nr:diheme cytochrome c [Betaproteobacteria bacterium]
ELMSAQGWRNLIAQLDRHFGIDASLDTRTRDAIAGLLAARASTRDKHAATEPTARITKTLWFVREHRKAGPARTSFVDCGACHANADQADYRERGRGQGRRY